jgi:hypothetical protein
LGDLRYSFSPTEASPIWGVVIDDARGDVRWVNHRAKRDIGFDNVLHLLSQDGPGHRCY